MSPAFQPFLHLMYDKDVFDENVILKWFKNPSQDDLLGIENQEKIRKQVHAWFVQLCKKRRRV